MKNPFGQIVSFEDYVDIIGIPKEQLNSEEVKNRINKWLVQATEQFDSMISGNGQLGRLYRWFEKLEDNEEDNYKKYKLIKAICSWVETFVIKGKFWVDGLPVINSNVDIQINSSSNDSNVEAKRKDIIQDLVSVGLYQTTNFGDNNTFQDNQQNAEQLIEDLIVLSTSELQQNYLRLNPQKSLEGNLDFANNDLVNGGNIIGSTQHARNNIQYYNIIDSTIDLNKNTVIGSLPQDPTTAADIAQINQNIANINQEQITQNTNISNNANEISSLKAKDIEQNNRLTQLEQETEDNFNEIANIKTKDQQQDNTIQSNTTSINANTNSINTLNQQVANNKNLLDQTIDGLRTLKPFQYVGEYQNGTSYNINQLVSYQNNLYLSKEDNNNTIPTSDKWLLINKDTVSVDLSNYYNKLEVDSIKSNLQNDITTNTNNITTLTQEVNTNKRNITNLATVQNQHDQLIQQNQTNITTNQTNITNLNNEVVKLAGDQTITGAKTFNNNVVISKNPTPLILKANNNDKTYMLIKSSDNTTNFSLGANSSNTSLEVNRGDLTLKTLQANKNVNFENVARVKFNRSVLEAGTEINAGFGGTNVKFIPEDNSTKTLQFYNANPTDQRRFNLLVPEPTQAQNPATKNYVDTAIANITPGSGGGSIDTSNFATLNTNQTISGEKTFTNAITITKTNGALQFKPGTNQPAYFEFYNGNTRIGYFGKGSSSNNNLTLGAQSGVIKLEPSTHVDVSNKKIINIADPTANQDAVNKRYVDNNTLSKTSTTAQTVAGQVSFTQPLTVATPTANTHATTKAYVDSAIANNSGSIPQQTLNQINNNTNNITTLQNRVNGNATNITALQNSTVKTTGNETINGTKTFANQIVANGGITNLPLPTNTNDAANKQYVDNRISNIPVYNEYNIILSNNGTFNNLQILTIDISRENSLIDKSWMIKFDRMGNNGNKYEGTFYYNFLLPEINQATWVESNVYFSNNRRFESAAKAGITIDRTSSNQLKLTFQLWDGGNRIKNVKLFTPR